MKNKNEISPSKKEIFDGEELVKQFEEKADALAEDARTLSARLEQEGKRVRQQMSVDSGPSTEEIVEANAKLTELRLRIFDKLRKLEDVVSP